MRSLDADTRVAPLGNGSELPFDLYLGVPVHRVPEVLEVLGADRRRVDPGGSARRSRHRGPECSRSGDCAEVGTPRAGVFAERQAATAARQIAARVRGGPAMPRYDGRGVCYIEFGGEEIGRVEVAFFEGRPHGTMEGPSVELAAEKRAFGASRTSGGSGASGLRFRSSSPTFGGSGDPCARVRTSRGGAAAVRLRSAAPTGAGAPATSRSHAPIRRR